MLSGLGFRRLDVEGERKQIKNPPCPCGGRGGTPISLREEQASGNL